MRLVYRLKLDFFPDCLRLLKLSGLLFFAQLFFFCAFSYAKENFPGPLVANKEDGLIQVEFAPNVLAPYRERRQRWGFIFDFKYIDFVPKDYVSPADGTGYELLIKNEPIRLYQVQLGPKLNTPIFSLGVELAYGSGEAKDNSLDRLTLLSFKKYGVAASIFFDTLFKEPYVVPYACYEYYKVSFTEIDDKAPVPIDFSMTLSNSSAYSLGFLLQLNWMDETTALAANNSVGMENTYLDFSYTKFMASSKPEEPNFQSSSSWGLGFRLEF